MKLINNRYKILKSMEKDNHCSKFVAMDLFQNNEKVFIYIMEENNFIKPFLHYCNTNFYEISSYSQPNMVSVISYGAVEFINDKFIKEGKYYYTTEYFEAQPLSMLDKGLNKKEIFQLYNKLAELLQFLHFHGIIYRYLSLETIFYTREKGAIEIKVLDLISLERGLLEKKYVELPTSYYIAPEVNYNIELDFATDIYSLGAVLYFVCLLEDFQHHQLLEKMEEITTNKDHLWEKQFLEVLKKMTNIDFNDRFKNIYEAHQKLSEIEDNIEPLKGKEVLGKLNFKIPLVGRSMELREILSCFTLKNQYSNPKECYLTIVSGDEGIGKSRLLKEVNHYLHLEKIVVVDTAIMSNGSHFYHLAPKLLKQIVKISPETLIERYSTDLIKFLPEIGTNRNVTPSKELSEKKELFKLYDRVTNFIIDTAIVHPIVIIVDDVDLGDVSILEFIDYFMNINSFKKAPVKMLISMNSYQRQLSTVKQYIEKWKESPYITMVKLARLTMEETAKMMKHILGCNKDYLDLAIHTMKDTEGNAKAIEDIVKEMYMQGLLTIRHDKKGRGYTWHFTEEDYEKLRRSFSIDESLMKQLEHISKEEKMLLKVIALFKTSVSTNIINKMIGEDQDYTVRFKNLRQLKIVNENLDDWGYTYGFYSKQLKEYLYRHIETKEKKALHLLASKVLEDLYKEEGRENKEELIYHLLESNQQDKAINYCIEAGRNMLKLKIYSQALTFYERAYGLLKDERDHRKIEILMNLADVYQKQGKNQRAIERLRDVITYGNLEKDHKSTIDAGNKIVYIHLMRNEIEKALEYIHKNLELSEQQDYIDGTLESAYFLLKLYVNTRNIQKAKSVYNQYISKAYVLKRYEHIGLFLKQKGMLEYFEGNVIDAIKCFKESIYFVEKSGAIGEIAATLNNIGTVFLDSFQDSGNAKRYSDRALHIAKQYNAMEDILRANHNIAHCYMVGGEYKKAIDCLNKNIGLSLEYQDEIIRFLSYVSLVECYIYEGEYKYAYSYLLKAKQELELYPHGDAYVEGYYEVSARFYMEIGAFRKALSVIDTFMQRFQHSNIRRLLKIKIIVFFARYHVGEKVHQEELLYILQEYRKSTYNRDRREWLYFSILYFYEEDNITMVKKLEKEDEALITIVDSDYFKTRKKYIHALLMSDSEEKLKALEALMHHEGQEGFAELRYYVYKDLGDTAYSLQQYYKATNYYLKALYALKLVYFKVPEEFRFNYLKIRDKYRIKQNLMDMKELIQNPKEVNAKQPAHNPLRNEKDIEDFFNISELQCLFQNNIFYDMALNQYKKVFSLRVNNIETLLKEFTQEPKHNLSLLLKLAAKHVLAFRGAIFTEDNHYQTVATLGQKIEIEEVKHVLEKVEKSGEVLLENNIKHFMRMEKDFTGAITKAVICLPIFLRKQEEGRREQEMRRRGHKKTQKILGYLYLESEEIFNNFSEEGCKKCEELLPLASLLLYNYNLRWTAFVDKLTKVFTRKYFEDTFNEEMINAKENQEELSVIMCDLDHFKSINDTYGHQEGDKILEKTGEILRRSVRKTDVIGRYGGEEFVLLLPNTPKEDAFNVAEKIRRGLMRSRILGSEKKVTISCGIATFPQDGVSKDMIIQRADQALYTAKEKGRNQTVLWEPGMDFTDKRIDRLAGIVSGNVVEDQKNVLIITEMIQLVTEDFSLREKIFLLLGQLIELSGAHEGILFVVKEGVITEELCRRQFEEKYIENINYNKELVERAVYMEKGDYLIDWDDTSEMDPFTGVPNWKSVIISPVKLNDKVEGIIYLSVLAKEKEFNFSSYNLIKSINGIVAAIINTSNKNNL